eukprot:14468882-Alexandrium_andersonii.AAC.1
MSRTRVGDLAYQACRGAFSLLLGIRQRALGLQRGPLTIAGVAEGVLVGVASLAARSPALCAISVVLHRPYHAFLGARVHHP